MILTKREYDILSFIVKGKTNQEIADELDYSCAWVKKEISKLYKMLSVKNRIQLVFDYHKYNYSKILNKQKQTEYKVEKKIIESYN